MDVDQLKMIPGIPFPELYEFFMDWKTPVAIATTYAVCVHLFNPSAEAAKLSRVEAKNTGVNNASKSSKFMTAFVFVHNLILAIYSGVTFVNMAYNMHKLFNRGSSIHDAVSIYFREKENQYLYNLYSIVIWIPSYGTKVSVIGVIYSTSPSSTKSLILPSLS
jgi:hypothetical protein